MANRTSGFFSGKAIVGVAIIAIGVLLLLDNIGFNLGINLWDFWPVILIIIGFEQLARPRESRQPVGGWILVVLGFILLGNSLDIIDIHFSDIWPFILIIVGLSLLRHAFWRPQTPSSGKDVVNLSAILGGGDYKYDSSRFQGGKITAIMGGAKIDLLNADFEGNEITIDAFVLWGGIEIFVPREWGVTLAGMPLLGGISDKTLQRPEGEKPSKILVIRGTVIMGGVEVKN